MTFNRRFHPIIVTTLILANLLSPNAPLLRAQDGTSVWLPLVRQVDGLSNALPATDLLFRTEITVQDPAQWARLSELAVPILQQEGDRAVILADYDQLQTLARLRYQPHNSIEFGALVNASAAQKPWLARSLQPLTDQLGAVRTAAAPTFAQAALTQDAQAALTAVRAAANQLSSEQRAGLAALPTLDDDGDDLTNTEESWWCTDPLNPNSDGDAKGYIDGQEVAALLDVTLSRTVRWGYGPPFGPPAAWPDFNNKDNNTATPACNDGDFDTIPDYAEAYMVGTQVGAQDMENTDGDKFDDGQELFGVTYCPGAPNSCGWGNYPRTQDFSFITSAMPSWVRPPGDSPFVAAYPVLEFNVDPATIRITTKEIRTIEKTITEGTEIAEGFAETKGNSTSVGTIDTNTRNGWQEHSSSVGGIEPASVKSASSFGQDQTNLLIVETKGNAWEPLTEEYFFLLDLIGTDQLGLFFPERELAIKRGQDIKRLGIHALSAKFWAPDDIIFIAEDLSLHRVKQGIITELLPPYSANGPIFLSQNRQYAAYLHPSDFSKDDSIPLTNGIAVLDLQTGQSKTLFELEGITMNLFGWVGNQLAVYVPFWDPTTLKPSEMMYIGLLPTDSSSTSIKAFASLPAVGSNLPFPVTSFDQKYIAYESNEGSVVALLEKPVYSVLPSNKNPFWTDRGLNFSGKQTRTLPFADVVGLQFEKSSMIQGDIPLPSSKSLLSSYHKFDANHASSPPLYRPVASNIAISAYYDQDRRRGYVEDWQGNQWTTNLNNPKDWGARCDNSGCSYDQHEGTDYNGQTGDDIFAAHTGNISRQVSCENTYQQGTLSYGTYVDITSTGNLADGNSYRTRYAHLDCKDLPILSAVELLPTQVGNMGNTGYSTGDHLHWGVYRNGSVVDPYQQGIVSDSPAQPTQLPLGSCDGTTMTSPTPSPDLPSKQKSTSFWVNIGRAAKSWWGKLTGGIQRSNESVDYSGIISTEACAGSGGQTNSGTLGIGGGGSGLAFNDNGGGNFTALRTWSETTTTGEGWSTSHSDVRTETEYAEITRSTVNTLVSSEAWSTATTADPTDAARLTFNYSLVNTGSDLAVQVTGLRANLLIGDLPVITTNLPDRTNIEPSKAKGPFSSDSIPLTLEQLAAIDNGAPIRVVLADYGYNDSLYDTNAWGRSVLFHVDDGIADGNETFDTYLIATNLIQNETYQETLARYFPITTFAGGDNDERTSTLTSITTPEYDANGEITSWVKHPVTDRAWWELSISTGGETPGVKEFNQMPAKAKTDIYLRYVVDTDGDGYTDRAERDASTDLNDPESHPRPLLVAAQQTKIDNNKATVQLALQNFGDFDASSVEIWAIAPDDTITIDDNLVGGGGRVRAGRRVVLGARIATPDLTAWATSTAKPISSGQYDGAATATFLFRADTAGTVGSTAGLQVSWSVDGTTWTPLDVGSGYTAWTPLALRDGLFMAFSPGNIAAGETFRFTTALPIDTFSYTINRTPPTPPLLVVSYNDAQGNHKFVTDVEVSQIQEDLIPYYTEMRRGLQLDVRQAAPFQVGANQAWLTLHNPSDTPVTGGGLSALVVTPDGAIAKEYVLDNQAFQPGPNVVTFNWNTADFTPAFDPTADYHLLVFATDRQGTIIENTVRDLDTLHKDALPTAIFAGETWNFGTVTQGEVLERTFTLANVGFADLQSRLAVPAGVTVLNATDQSNQPGDVTTLQMTLDTRVLPTGPYSGTIALRTSDPNNPRYTMPVTGMIEPLTGDAYTRPVEDRPLDVEVWVPGVHDRGDLVQFSHSLDPNPDQIHPVKVFSQDERLLGMGEHAISFADSTTLVGGYGTGVDGDIEINTDTTFSPARTALAQTTQPGQATVELVNATGFDVGEEILLLQVQGEQAGTYEFARIYLKTNNQLTLYRGLSNPFTQSGYAKVQVIQVPNYRNVKITSTGRWRAPAWNGNDGGAIIFRAAESLLIEAGGLIDATGSGFRGTAHGPVYRHQTGVQGEGYSGNGSQTWSANGNGGGGGQGSQDGGGGGGGGHATAGANGVTGQPNSRSGGSGGQSVGTPNLRQWFFGGAGGEGGADEDGGNPGGGGNGGGIIALFAKAGIVNGSIYSNGTSGGNGCQGCGGGGSGMAGGGGGAGGTIFMQGFDLTLNSPVLQVSGGAGGYGYERGGHGGSGAAGRIHAEYCGTLTGPVVPLIDQSVISCAIAYQANTLAPSGTNLIIPEHFSAGQQFRIQYGQKLDFAAAGGLTTLLNVPAGNWTSATLDALVSGVGTGDLTLKVDVGNNGTWDWEESRSVNDATTFSSLNLAAAFAPYVTGAGEKTVEVKVYLSKPGQLLLTNMAITREHTVELAPSFTLGGTSTEGDMVPFTTTVANRGAVDSGPLTVSYYATRNAQRTPQYIGSAFIANIPPNSSEPAPFAWHTLGFTGPVTVTALVDPYNRLVESDETNNSRSGQLTILTRPDLTIPVITLSNREPLVGERVQVSATLSNRGQTLAGAQSLALYRNHPDGGGILLQSQHINSLAATTVSTVTFTWTPDEPGLHRLYLRSDGEHSINEFDESNNDNWLDVYVGAPSPLTVDSGAIDDSTYSQVKGFGVLDLGDSDEIGKCGDAAYQTFRRDPTGKVAYRFDHLLPGHFYHLDLVLYECGQNYGRQQSVSVDGLTIAGPIDLGSGKVETRSLLLDPALYADGTISVTVSVAGSGGALVNQIALVDVDYRYADAGGEKDQPYPSGMRPYGWLDGVHQTPWGKLPYQSLRENQAGAAIRYRFDTLAPAKEYQVHFSFFQGNGNPRIQQISVDELPLSGDFTLLAGQRNTQRVTLPKESYADGTVTLTVRRTDGATAGAMINEIALEEVTQQPPPYCQVTGTPNYTIAYGDVTINGQLAPVDTIVTAENPRGDVVGCFVVTSSGQYGFMSIFGEDTSSSPSIPGMRTGEPVLFRVNGAIAVPSAQLYWQDDKSRHRINLDGSLPPKQYLLLRPNWNLISTRLTPPVPLLELVFQSIASKYCLVLGQTGIYDCNVPASFRGLREVAPGQGYYLKVDGNAGINLVIEGTPVAANTAIRLQKGLNWIGYLPAVKLPVATALQSIADDLLQVTDGLARTYAPGDIGFNTLTEMTPGAGYLIHVSEAVTLTYPMTDTGQSAAGDSSERPGVLDGVSCAGVEATPQFMLLYGRLTLDGVGVAVGDQVEAVTPRGEVAGCFIVTTAGQYGFMPLFGSDNSLPGFQPGEPIMLRVNGTAVTLPAPLFWQDDKSTHRLNLGGDAETISTQIYLPYTSR